MKKIQIYTKLLTAFLLLLPAISYAQADEPIHDPIEPVNRGIFWFNEQADYYVIKPVAKGYDYVMPTVARKGVKNFFLNLRYPSYLVSDLVQLKFKQAGHHTSRFIINSTFGLLGLIDVAKDHGYPDKEEDFGLALAYNGVPAGPYIVLPFLGPSNLRDASGVIVDFFLDPLYWVAASPDLSNSESTAVSLGGTGLRVINTRADMIENINTAHDSALDYYLFLQSAYYQYRRGLLYDGHPPEEEEEPIPGESKRSHQ